MAYDVDMIRDFIDQLLWGLRVDHFEMTGGPNALNPELVDQEKKNFKRRGVLRLLTLFSLRRDKPELTERQMAEALRRFAATMAKKREEQLLHLEALSDLFSEACACAEGQMIEVTAPASKILDGTWFGEKLDDME
jgi:hypothetical protein